MNYFKRNNKMAIRRMIKNKIPKVKKVTNIKFQELCVLLACCCYDCLEDTKECNDCHYKKCICGYVTLCKYNLNKESGICKFFVNKEIIFHSIMKNLRKKKE